MLIKKRSNVRVLLGAIVLGILPLTGCYERVVSAKGPGASQYTIYEPNLKEDNEVMRIPFLDDLGDLIFGTKKPIKNRR